MKEVNLRDYYSHYTTDKIVEVPDEVFAIPCPCLEPAKCPNERGGVTTTAIPSPWPIVQAPI